MNIAKEILDEMALRRSDAKARYRRILAEALGPGQINSSDVVSRLIPLMAVAGISDKDLRNDLAGPMQAQSTQTANLTAGIRWSKTGQRQTATTIIPLDDPTFQSGGLAAGAYQFIPMDGQTDDEFRRLVRVANREAGTIADRVEALRKYSIKKTGINDPAGAEAIAMALPLWRILLAAAKADILIERGEIRENPREIMLGQLGRGDLVQPSVAGTTGLL